MCTVLLPPGVNPIAVITYIISYQINTDKWSHTLLSRHCNNTVCPCSMLQGVHLIHSNGKVTHSIDLAVRMYQGHSLKNVGVPYSVNKLVI